MRELILKEISKHSPESSTNHRSNSATITPYSHKKIQPKISDLLQKVTNHVENPIISIELCPKFLVDYEQFDRLPNALFYSITWHKPSACDGDDDLFNADKEIPAFSLATALIKRNKTVMFHITCWNLKRFEALAFLDRVRDLNVRNLFVIRGDYNDEEGTHLDFQDPIEFIKFIRRHYGDYFSIGVAGYPSTHPKAQSQYEDLLFLREKINAGGDFIITQMEFDMNAIEAFIVNCIHLGMNVPVLPGIYIIESEKSLRTMASMCGVHISDHVALVLQQLRKRQPSAARQYGVDQAALLIQQLMSSVSDCRTAATLCAGIHLFSLNKFDNVLLVSERVGLLQSIPRLIL